MAETTQNSRTSLALVARTIEKIKAFSKENNIIMYMAVEAMVDVVLSDDDLKAAVVERAKQISEENKLSKSNIGAKIGKLPKDLKRKLEKMSPEELAELLKKVA